MRSVLVLCAVLFALSFAARADAQSESARLLDEASAFNQADNLDEAYRLAERAYNLAQTQVEEFHALNLLSEVRYRQERWRESEALTAEALAILEEFFPDSIDMISHLVARQAATALQQGNYTEWQRLNARHLDLNRTNNELLWRYEDGGMRHRLTGYFCPQSGEAAALRELITFDAAGSDVACQYTLFDQPRPIVTVHVYFQPDSDFDAAFTDATTGMMAAFPDARTRDQGDFAVGDVPVRFAIYRTPDRDTGVWTTHINAWTVKLRLTHFGDLDRDDIDAMAAQVFGNVPDMREHLARCGQLGGATDLRADEGDVIGTTANALMGSLLSAGSDAQSLEQASTDRLQCYAGPAEIGGRGVAYAEMGPDGEPARFVARAASGEGFQILAEPDPNLGRIAQEMAQEDPDGGALMFAARLRDGETTHYFGSFEGPPSLDGFLALVRGVLNGNIRALSTHSIAEGGGGQLIIHTGSDLDTTPEEAPEDASPEGKD